VVYGGGGISPDYIVKPPAASEFMQNLIRRDMFFQFATSFLDSRGQTIKTTYGEDLQRFVGSYMISDEMMQEFRTFAKTKGMTIEDKDLQKDAVYVKARIKAEIASVFWGNSGRYRVILEVDPQFQKAIALVPEAVKFAKLN
jgi:carboxyl-terminal processing protease